MHLIYLALFVFLFLFTIDKFRNNKSEDFDKKYFIKSFLKVFSGIAILFIGAGAFLYYQLTIDIEKQFTNEFLTPIDQVSDLRGYGVGFLDSGFELCFKSGAKIELVDNEKYQIIEDIATKQKTIDNFIRYFKSGKYEYYHEALLNNNIEDFEIKHFYIKPSYISERWFVSLKKKGLYYLSGEN